MVQELKLTSPQEFFHQHLISAMRSSHLVLSKEVEFYLVNLLCAFVNPERNLPEKDLDPLQTPLAILLQKAAEAPIEDRLKILRSLGDTSLYISGFFQDYFNRKTYNIDYFISVGTHAYSNASTLTRKLYRDVHFSSLFSSLAEKFPTIVEVVACISDDLGIAQDKDILAIYERWLHNRSDRLLNKLKEHGISPIALESKVKQ